MNFGNSENVSDLILAIIIVLKVVVESSSSHTHGSVYDATVIE